MKDDILISVVIPCYNAGKYLGRTFRALDSQGYRNFEVIIVDDGSADNSLEIATGYVRERENCRVFSYENGGVSEARNRGIEKALGEYIYFLDADDYIYPTLFEDMARLIASHGTPDVVRFGFKWHYGDVDVSEMDKVHYSGVFSELIAEKDIVDKIVKPLIGFSEEDLYDYYKNRKWSWKEDDIPVWAHFYKKSLIVDNGLWFERGLKMGEDRFFNLLVMAYAKNVVCTPNIYYLYLSTDGGLLRTIYKNVRGLYKDKVRALEQRGKVRNMYLEKKSVDLWPYYRGSNVLACLQLAVELSKLPLCEGLPMYVKFVEQQAIQESINGLKTDGAPLKMKVPLEMLKYHMSRTLFMLIWLAVKLGMKAKI